MLGGRWEGVGGRFLAQCGVWCLQRRAGSRRRQWGAAVEQRVMRMALQGVLALQAALEKGLGRRHRALSLSLPLPCFLPVHRQLQSVLDFWPSLRPC